MKKTYAFVFILMVLTSWSIVCGQPLEASENSWKTVTTSPSVIGSCEAAVIDNKIFIFTSHTAYVYDPAEGSWDTIKPMPTSRSIFALASYQNKIYVIGGVNYTSPYSGTATSCPLNEVYDIETDTWETREPMPTARSQIQAECVNGKIYVIGGITAGPYSAVKTNEVYDIATDSWETKEEIPYHVALAGSTVLDNKIYVIGGQNEYHEPMNPGFVQIYDPETDTWMQGTPHPHPAWLGEEAAATTGFAAPQKIYVMGGSEGFARATNSCYVYDPKMDTWAVAASIPRIQEGFALVNVNDVLYAIGGFDGWSVSYSEVLQYVPFGYGTIPLICSPQNFGNYTSSSVPFTFELEVPALSLSYSLDNGEEVSISGNTTLNGLANGNHTLLIYGTDEQGNTSTLRTIIFGVDATPITLIIIPITTATVIVISACLLFYYKKRRKLQTA